MIRGRWPQATPDGHSAPSTRTVALPSSIVTERRIVRSGAFVQVAVRFDGTVSPIVQGFFSVPEESLTVDTRVSMALVPRIVASIT